MYIILFEKRVIKDFEGVPKTYKEKIISKINDLSSKPFPPGTKKLKGRNAWRIRIGVYRVIYTVEHEKLIIMIVKVSHRKDVY